MYNFEFKVEKVETDLLFHIVTYIWVLLFEYKKKISTWFYASIIDWDF